jgi:magnesium-transporting ATPase (P-type)
MLFMFQILDLCFNKDEIAERVQTLIDEFAERGLRSLAVAYQVAYQTHPKHQFQFVPDNYSI